MPRRKDTLDELPLGTRAKNALRHDGILSLEDIAKQYAGFENELLGCGEKTKEELLGFLKARSIELRPHPNQSASFRLGAALSKMVRLESELDETRKEIREILRVYPELDWGNAE